MNHAITEPECERCFSTVNIIRLESGKVWCESCDDVKCLEIGCERPAVKNGGCAVCSTGIHADEYADENEWETSK